MYPCMAVCGKQHNLTNVCITSFFLYVALTLTETKDIFLPKGKVKRHSEFDRHSNEHHIHMIQAIPRDRESAIPEKYFNAPANCNLHDYTLTLNNPHTCTHHTEIFLLILIRTIPSHYDRRKAIRETWTSKQYFPRLNMPLMFLFGSVKNLSTQAELEQESAKYRDIAQEDFLDSYNSLTLKTVMAWKWAYSFCPHASYVMIANDEVVVDIFKLVPYLVSQIKTSGLQFTLCHLYPCCTRVYRRHPKYSVSKDLYDGNAYPSYCSGTGYVAPSRVIHRLYHMSKHTPMFMPDDAWIGVLAEKLGIGFIDTYLSYSGIRNKPTLMKSFNNSDYLTSPVLFGVVDYDFPGKEAEIIRTVWRMILQHHQSQKQFDVKRYMSTYYSTNTSTDSHVYHVAIIVLIIDLLVMALLGYMIFMRRKSNILKKCYHRLCCIRT